MTTKKILLILMGVIATLSLLIAIFVGSIVGIVFYSINNSAATITAKEFLKKNETLKQDIGEIKDFGMFVTGNIKERNSDGSASLFLKVIGEKKTVNATVSLAYRDGSDWRITGASYKTLDGKTIELLKKYEDE